MEPAQPFNLLHWLFLIPIAAVALLLAKFISAWPNLPDRVAIHFGITGQPNSYASKSVFAVILVIVAVAFIGAGLLLNQMAPPPALIGVITGSVICLIAFWQAIDFNLTGKPLRMGIVFIPVVVLLAALFFFVFTNQPHPKP